MMTADVKTHEAHAEAEDTAVAGSHIMMQIDIVGDGPRLALVGGGLTGWKSWEPHAERLSTTRTVARLQPLNVQYGLENRPLPDGYSAKTESAALKAALDEAGWLEAIDLVGWSYGALIALDFALHHPERIRTLTLIEPPAGWMLPEDAHDDPEIRAIQSLEIDGDVSAADLEAFLRAAGLVAAGSTPSELPQWPVWMEHRQSLRPNLDPLIHEDNSALLDAFDRPVLLVMGTETAWYYRCIQEGLASRFAQARLIELPTRHAPHIVSMDEFLEELGRLHRDGKVSNDQHLNDMRQVTSTDGTSIGYNVRGQGRPLLFVHGTTADHRSWDRVAPFIDRHAELYAMDRRGRGLSGDAPDYHWMREAEDVAAVVESIGEPVVVFGHSFGGLISLEAALLTDQIAGLILYEPPIPTGIPTIPQGVLKQTESLIDDDELEEAMSLFLREAAKISEQELEAYRRSPLWKARIPQVVTAPRELGVEETYVFDPERFGRFQVPTLFLLGEESPDMYRNAVDVAHSALPNSEIVILPGQQHIAHHSAPELLAREIIRFLQR